MRWFVILVIVGGLVACGVFGFRSLSQNKPAITYKSEPVIRRTLISTVTATGNLEPLVKVLVGSQVSGTVTRWFADFNQRVEKDFVLAELDQDRFKATLEHRQAAAAAARARVEQAQAAHSDTVLRRTHTESNYARNAANEIELQTAKIAEQEALASVHASEAEVEQAEAEARLAAVDLARTIIRSPIDGVVISRNVDAGQTVAASLTAPTLFTIANDLAKMQVNAAVSETDIGKIREGNVAEFRVDAYPDRRFQGIVSQVRYAETIIDNVVTYTTLINVDNPDLALRPGMTATIYFEVDRAEDVLLVPNAAMRFNPQAVAESGDWMRAGKARPMQPRVFRLEQGQPKAVDITPGLTDGTFTEVRSGTLREGDEVILEQIGGRAPPAVNMRTPRFAG